METARLTDFKTMVCHISTFRSWDHSGAQNSKNRNYQIGTIISWKRRQEQFDSLEPRTRCLNVWSGGEFSMTYNRHIVMETHTIWSLSQIVSTFIARHDKQCRRSIWKIYPLQLFYIEAKFCNPLIISQLLAVHLSRLNWLFIGTLPCSPYAIETRPRFSAISFHIWGQPFKYTIK